MAKRDRDPELVKLDKEVLRVVKKHGPMRFNGVAQLVTGTSVKDSREIDRALQRLRKDGKLTYESKVGWSAL